MNSEGLELFYNWIVNDDPSIPREKLKSRDIRDKLPLVLENEEARELMLSDEVSIDEAYSSLPNKNKEKKKLEKITDDLKSYLIDIKHSHKLSQKEKKALIELKNQIIELL
jgi:K+/H+ antiporter YhaU regulatory subunit KhtT